MDNLISDILLYLIQWLNFEDKLTLRLTSKRWLDILNKKYIIREFVNNKFAEYIQITLETDLPERINIAFYHIELKTYVIDEAERNKIRNNSIINTVPTFYSRDQKFIDKLVIPDEFIDYITKVMLDPDSNVFMDTYCNLMLLSRLNFGGMYRLTALQEEISCLQEWFPFYEKYCVCDNVKSINSIISYILRHKVIMYVNCNKDSVNYGKIKKVTISERAYGTINMHNDSDVFITDIKLY